MSTSNLDHAYGIKGVQYKSTQYEKKSIIYFAEMVYQKIRCPNCSSKNSHFKGQKKRRFRMIPVGSNKCFLDVILHRLKCVDCGHMWWPRLSFMKGKSQMTRAFIQFAFDLLSMSTVQDVSRLLGISWNVVKRIHKMKLKKLYKKIDLKGVKYISLDEFAIKKGHEYMSAFTTLSQGESFTL